MQRDGVEVPFPRRTPAALLAVLLVHGARSVASDRLADDLWSGRPPPTARSALQMHVTALRRALGPGAPISTEPGGYRLAVEPAQVDARRFELAAERGRRLLRRGAPAEAAIELATALGEWRGPALADFADAPFARIEAQRLDEARVTALEDRFEAELSCGEHASLVAALMRLVAEHPYRERLRGLLMLALYRGGRQADALSAYRDGRDALVTDLGLEPGPELRELERAILAQDVALPPRLTVGDAKEPPQAVASATLPPLPIPPTPTVGREHDLARLRALVEDDGAQLVTVVGPAGVGKSRLAVELAHRLERTFADGAHFVSLAPLGTPELVASTIMRTLGLAPAQGQSVEELLIRHCADRAMLLVLDNFEHLLDAARLVSDLLASAPRLTVVATSREPLHVRAERVFELPPLAVPAVATAAEDFARGAAPALELFVGIARARRADFDLAPADLPVACDICRRLDGLPLAIELAAGSLGASSVSSLAARMRAGLDALSPGPRDVPARQRTLRATLQWSYDLLGPVEQQALMAVSVFAGGFTLEAAEAVTGVSLDVLERLVAKQLLTVTRRRREMRFGMLETIREFGVERRAALGGDDVRRRHLEYFVMFTETRAPELRRSWSTALAAELEDELDNLRVALAYAVERPDPELALRLVVGAADHWRIRQDDEGIRWFADALALPRDAVDPRLVARALAEFTYNDGHPDWDAAEAAGRASLESYEALGDRAGACRSLAALALVTSLQGRVEEGFAHATRAVSLAREVQDPVLLAHGLAFATGAAPTLGEAVDLGEEAIALFLPWQNWRCIAVIHHNIAYRAIALGDYELAGRHVAEARRHVNTSEDPSWLAYTYGNDGLIALFTDRLADAAAAFGDELAMAAALTMDPLVREAVAGIAALHAAKQRDNVAATLTGAAESFHVGFPAPEIDRRLEDRFFRSSRERLGSRDWEEALERGRDLPLAQAVSLASDSLAVLDVGVEAPH